MNTQGMMYNGTKLVPYSEIVTGYCLENDLEKTEGMCIIHALLEACIDNDDRKEAKKAIFTLLDMMF